MPTTLGDRVRTGAAGSDLHRGWWPLIALFLALTLLSTAMLYVLAPWTDRYFAWTVRPSLSAAFLGAGYCAGFVLVVLMALRARWVDVRVGFIAIFVFVVATMVATLAHLDRFHLDAAGAGARAAAWLWLAVYVIVPPAMALLLVLQRRSSAPDPPRARPMPGPVAVALVVQGVILTAAGVLLLALPARMDAVWPWALTPLTGRAIGSWWLALGVAAGHAVLESDLRRLKAAALTYVVFAVLQLGALIRFADDMRWDRPGAWVYVAVLISIAAVGASGIAAGRRDAERTL